MAALLFLAWLGASFARLSQASKIRPESLKAAYIFNFALFTEWPNDSQNRRRPFLICVHNDDESAAELIEVTKKKIRGQTTAVEPNPSYPETCNILVLDDSDKSDQASLLQRVKNFPVLTVGTSAGFVNAGGLIGLLTDDDRLTFEVNLTAAEAVGLRFDSRMLKLAARIDGTPQRPRD